LKNGGDLGTTTHASYADTYAEVKRSRGNRFRNKAPTLMMMMMIIIIIIIIMQA